jgi:hypothetical protein
MTLLPLRFPADCLTWGDHLAQETRWEAVGKTVISAPISAMMSWAQIVPMPGNGVELGDLVQVGLGQCLDLGGELFDPEPGHASAPARKATEALSPRIKVRSLGP